ncbi:hypothetical protein MJO28_008500 [Puccinia striiformis f. sp. tritici]|uniref:Uncharacterized protein n=1 Tax=Puccinia striiformis f. sp. tritici TaxID=168172 RepID=A0ACC0EBK3_9BASI|nr:hypothetical protein MJO28_008500 [Puccinia striiformis f. sp. tritici]
MQPNLPSSAKPSSATRKPSINNNSSRLPSRVLRSNSKEPAESNQHSLKRSLNDYDQAASAKRPSLWSRGPRLDEMSTPAMARHTTALPPSTQRSTRTPKSQPEQVLLAHDRARELNKKLQVAQEQIDRLEHQDSQAGDHELALERKVLDLERELRETYIRLEDRELRVSKLEQDRIVVSNQIDAQQKESLEAIAVAEKNMKQSELLAQTVKEELSKLKERNSSLEQLVRLSTHNEARAKQLSSDSTTRIQLLEEDKARLQNENEQLRSNISQHQSDLEKLRQEKNTLSSSGSADSSSNRDILRKELIRQVDQYKTMEQANSRMTRELVSLRSRHSNAELLKEENHQLKQRLKSFDQIRQQLASTEVKLTQLTQEREEWNVFLQENQQKEFKNPHEFFKDLGTKRIENISLKSRLTSKESEIKSRDRMISELELRLEELEGERNLEFTEKIKAQTQLSLSERNRDLDKRRIKMLNEQLKSYTEEEKIIITTSDNSDYQHKDIQINQLKELLDTQQIELSHLQSESDQLRQQLQSSSISTSNESTRLTDKGTALNTTLSEQIDRNEDLENELDELTDANEIMKLEIDSLKLQVHRLERDLGRGEFNSNLIQVLSPDGSPLEVEQSIRTSMLDSLRAENLALLNQISKLTSSSSKKKNPNPTSENQQQQHDDDDLVPRESLLSSQLENQRLTKEVSNQIKARERLCEMYKETTVTYKRAIWEILGYSLEAVSNGEFRLRSAFKDDSSSTLLFVPSSNSSNSFEFKVNKNSSFHKSDLFTNSYQIWVNKFNSIPAFTAALTIDLVKSCSAS